MNRKILILLLSILAISCDFKKKTPTKISKSFLLGKEFVADAKTIMGSKYFEFTDINKVKYYIRDKTSYGYNGTYEFEYDGKGNQFIKIVEEKGKLMVLLLVKTPAELEIVKVKPKVYKGTTVLSFDIKHKIGKIYEFKPQP